MSANPTTNSSGVGSSPTGSAATPGRAPYPTSASAGGASLKTAYDILMSNLAQKRPATTGLPSFSTPSSGTSAAGFNSSSAPSSSAVRPGGEPTGRSSATRREEEIAQKMEDYRKYMTEYHRMAELASALKSTGRPPSHLAEFLNHRTSSSPSAGGSETRRTPYNGYGRAAAPKDDTETSATSEEESDEGTYSDDHDNESTSTSDAGEPSRPTTTAAAGAAYGTAAKATPTTAAGVRGRMSAAAHQKHEDSSRGSSFHSLKSDEDRDGFGIHLRHSMYDSSSTAKKPYPKPPLASSGGSDTASGTTHHTEENESDDTTTKSSEEEDLSQYPWTRQYTSRRTNPSANASHTGPGVSSAAEAAREYFAAKQRSEASSRPFPGSFRTASDTRTANPPTSSTYRGAVPSPPPRRSAAASSKSRFGITDAQKRLWGIEDEASDEKAASEYTSSTTSSELEETTSGSRAKTRRAAKGSPLLRSKPATPSTSSSSSSRGSKERSDDGEEEEESDEEESEEVAAARRQRWFTLHSLRVMRAQLKGELPCPKNTSECSSTANTNSGSAVKQTASPISIPMTAPPSPPSDRLKVVGKGEGAALLTLALHQASAAIANATSNSSTFNQQVAQLQKVVEGDAAGVEKSPHNVESEVANPAATAWVPFDDLEVSHKLLEACLTTTQALFDLTPFTPLSKRELPCQEATLALAQRREVLLAKEKELREHPPTTEVLSLAEVAARSDFEALQHSIVAQAQPLLSHFSAIHERRSFIAGKQQLLQQKQATLRSKRTELETTEMQRRVTASSVVGVEHHIRSLKERNERLEEEQRSLNAAVKEVNEKDSWLFECVEDWRKFLREREEELQDAESAHDGVEEAFQSKLLEVTKLRKVIMDDPEGRTSSTGVEKEWAHNSSIAGLFSRPNSSP